MLPVPLNVFVAGFCDVVLKRCEYTRRLNKFTDFRETSDEKIYGLQRRPIVDFLVGEERVVLMSNMAVVVVTLQPVRSLSGYTDQRSGWAVPNLVYGLQLKGSYDTDAV